MLGLDPVAQRFERRAIGAVDRRVPPHIGDDGRRPARPEGRRARLSDARRSAGDDGNLCVQTGDDGRIRGERLDQRERWKSGWSGRQYSDTRVLEQRLFENIFYRKLGSPHAMLSPKTQTKTEVAFSVLRGAIESGDLPPGDRLRANQLVEQLNMSPTPIREALRLLQAEGLVEYRAHQGMVVAEYSPESVIEVYRMRALLEPLATELSTERATDAQIAEMRAAHDALHDALQGHDIGPEIANLNADWHRAVYTPAESRLLIEFINRLWSAVPVTAFWSTNRSQKSLDQHAAIQAAIEARDVARAADLMREHVEDGARTNLESLRARRGRAGRRQSEEKAGGDD